MVFLAAVHDELLRDPATRARGLLPDRGRRRARARARARRSPPSAPTARRRWPPRSRTRRTQTNEVARCGCLLPAFAAVAGDAAARADRDRGERGAEPAVGPLRLRLRRPGRRARLVTADDRVRAGRARTSRRSIHRRCAGARGVDLAPVDASDPADARWLRACLWPDQTARQARLAAALAVAREHPVDVRRGDALDVLPELIAEAPADALVCVFHTAVLIYFDARADRRAARRCSRRSSATSRGSAARRPACSSRTRREPGARLHFALAAGPSGRARPARPHGPPRRLAGVVRLGIAALEAPGGVAQHVARVLEVRDPREPCR